MSGGGWGRGPMGRRSGALGADGHWPGWGAVGVRVGCTGARHGSAGGCVFSQIGPARDARPRGRGIPVRKASLRHDASIAAPCATFHPSTLPIFSTCAKLPFCTFFYPPPSLPNAHLAVVIHFCKAPVFLVSTATFFVSELVYRGSTLILSMFFLYYERRRFAGSHISMP